MRQKESREFDTFSAKVTVECAKTRELAAKASGSEREAYMRIEARLDHLLLTLLKNGWDEQTMKAAERMLLGILSERDVYTADLEQAMQALDGVLLSQFHYHLTTKAREILEALPFSERRQVMKDILEICQQSAFRIHEGDDTDPDALMVFQQLDFNGIGRYVREQSGDTELLRAFFDALAEEFDQTLQGLNEENISDDAAITPVSGPDLEEVPDEDEVRGAMKHALSDAQDHSSSGKGDSNQDDNDDNEYVSLPPPPIFAMPTRPDVEEIPPSK